MAGSDEVVKFRVVIEGPSDAARADLEPAFPDPDPYGVDDLGSDIQAGRAVLFAVYVADDDGTETRQGSMAARIESNPTGLEFVILGAGGRAMAGVSSFVDALMPLWEATAKAAGARWVRVHTARPGLEKVLADRHGFKRSEIVLRKGLV